MTGAPLPPDPRYASIQTATHGSGFLIDQRHVLTATRLLDNDATPIVMVGETSPHPLQTGGFSTHGSTACLTLKNDSAYRAVVDQLPTRFPRLVSIKAKFLVEPEPLIVRVVGRARTEAGWGLVECCGTLRHLEDVEEAHDSGDLVFIEQDALPADCETLVGAAVVVYGDEKCLVGLVTDVYTIDSRRRLLVAPIQRDASTTTVDSVISLLRQRAPTLPSCMIDTGHLPKHEGLGNTQDEILASVAALLQ